jgi:WhiB family redox-sensing transcriptional regulator
MKREMRAKAVCAGCPVVESCLRWALAAREPYGVWGGTSAEEREAMLARRPA